MGIKRELVDEFKDQLRIVHEMEVGDEKYKVAVDGITKIADRIIEIEKLEKAEAENEVKWASVKMDQEHKAKQLKQEKIDSAIRHCIEVAKIIGPGGLAVWIYLTSMEYEENGLIPTTEGGRAAIRSLFKFIK